MVASDTRTVRRETGPIRGPSRCLQQRANDASPLFRTGDILTKFALECPCINLTVNGQLARWTRSGTPLLWAVGHAGLTGQVRVRIRGLRGVPVQSTASLSPCRCRFAAEGASVTTSKDGAGGALDAEQPGSINRAAGGYASQDGMAVSALADAARTEPKSTPPSPTLPLRHIRARADAIHGAIARGGA